jgi:hypothetical protein
VINLRVYGSDSISGHFNMHDHLQPVCDDQETLKDSIDSEDNKTLHDEPVYDYLLITGILTRTLTKLYPTEGATHVTMTLFCKVCGSFVFTSVGVSATSTLQFAVFTYMCIRTVQLNKPEESMKQCMVSMALRWLIWFVTPFLGAADSSSKDGPIMVMLTIYQLCTCMNQCGLKLVDLSTAAMMLPLKVVVHLFISVTRVTKRCHIVLYLLNKCTCYKWRSRRMEWGSNAEAAETVNKISK